MAPACRAQRGVGIVGLQQHNIVQLNTHKLAGVLDKHVVAALQDGIAGEGLVAGGRGTGRATLCRAKAKAARRLATDTGLGR